MNAIERLYLRARHWQLFILFMGPFVVAQVFIMNAIVAIRTLEEFQSVIRVVAAVTVILALVFFGWFWSMGSFLNSLIREHMRPRLGFFRFALIYSPLYTAVFLVLIGMSPGMTPLIIPFHLLAMFCTFYALYFVSKCLVLAETGKAASFSDFAGPFFLIWFFPIGLWIIQPRINRLFAARAGAGRVDAPA